MNFNKGEYIIVQSKIKTDENYRKKVLYLITALSGDIATIRCFDRTKSPMYTVNLTFEHVTIRKATTEEISKNLLRIFSNS